MAVTSPVFLLVRSPYTFQELRTYYKASSKELGGMSILARCSEKRLLLDPVRTSKFRRLWNNWKSPVLTSIQTKG